MIPDPALDEYLPHVESVFRKLHEIPIDLVSRKLSSTSRVAEAIELLFALPTGRFARGEIVRLLTHPALVGDATIDAIDGIFSEKRVCRRCHIGERNEFCAPSLEYWAHDRG